MTFVDADCTRQNLSAPRLCAHAIFLPPNPG
jgi:hypothetical protein